MNKPLLCIHGHFYQPPREDPFSGESRVEPSAAPYQNWNERITAECYGPNAQGGNFDHISFNLGGTLARWLEGADGATYSAIVASARRHQARYGVTNGVAQSVHHTILPLARGRDKRCQVRWGIASFRHRFGHRPEGIWLPEMAVDHETLDVVADAGLRFVILSQEQVSGDLDQGAGPYRVILSGERQLAVFVRDNGLSNYLSFEMPSPEDAREWMNSALSQRNTGSLALVATDGETFGHHHRQGVDVLQNLVHPAPNDGYRVTTLARHLSESPPTAEIEVRDNTSWSCSHNLGRWATGCPCTPGCGHWKGALRRALDNLSRDIDEVYADVMRSRDVAPWRLRDDYINVLLGRVTPPQFLRDNHLAHLSEALQRRIITLLHAQVYRQRMFVSCAFFFEELERIEPRYAIANALQAVALTYYATGDDLTRAFRRDLSVAVSPQTGRTGADILEELMSEAQFDTGPLGGDMALSWPR